MVGKRNVQANIAFRLQHTKFSVLRLKIQNSKLKFGN